VTTSVLDPRDDFENNALGTVQRLEADAARRGTIRFFILRVIQQQSMGGWKTQWSEQGSDAATITRPAARLPETQPSLSLALRMFQRAQATSTVRELCAHLWPAHGGLFVKVASWHTPIRHRGFRAGFAWFIIAAVTGKPITIYGDGKQVRDVLFVSDLLDAYQAAIDRKLI